ncbi:16.9 kDa class I heat shock protein 3-like [Macadamia integrifolia]|uniref:16.9 kDa class I heat shock protein 3-like n=1 Tax=Macadamia integrifolia TaxID=60698 RepID=UPI001C501D55|nr:16.9 kDa class I heat shock protein 3-like [Macadamia integrifolia]
MMTTLGPWLGGRGDLWDPFDMFGLTQRRGGDRDQASALALPNVDWRETDNAHIIRLDLPGVKKDEVGVHVEEGNVLRISGKWSNKEEEHKDDKWHRVERQRGTFVRRFRLPENANIDGVKCSMENGVLSVEVPKNVTQAPDKEGRAININ